MEPWDWDEDLGMWDENMSWWENTLVQLCSVAVMGVIGVIVYAIVWLIEYFGK